MKSIKFLKKQATKAAKLSFNKGILDATVAKKFIKSFKDLPLGEAAPSLTYYLQAVKRELAKTTLTIESASKVTSAQMKDIENTFKKDFQVLETREEITPSLLGGVKVKIGDVIFDGSVKERLSQLKQAIVN